MTFSNDQQLKSFMKKEAERLNISINSAFRTYYSFELLKRLSKFNDKQIVVKGSLSQYIHLKELTRPILDIDLSSAMYHNIPITLIYKSIYEINDEFVNFDIKSLPRKTKNGIYKIPIMANITFPDTNKKMEISVPVDFKENNDVIIEKQYKAINPLFINSEKFYFLTPSFEEHLAEKLYIVLNNNDSDKINTRVKDFYDIYKLHGMDYDFEKFTLYLQYLLFLYKKDINNMDITFLNNDYINKHLEMWDKMKSKYDFVDKDLQLNETVYYTNAVLKEQIQKLKSNDYKYKALHLINKRTI